MPVPHWAARVGWGRVFQGLETSAPRAAARRYTPKKRTDAHVMSLRRLAAVKLAML